MATVCYTERRGAVLTPSALGCLAAVPTVNVSAGCAHRCLYCYAQGYSQYPGENTVLVYRDTAARATEELRRKRRRPLAVYFCPSCDPFQPVEEVLDMTYETMRGVLEAGVAIEFVTKGQVPARFIDLFARHVGQVSGQVGITTLEAGLAATLEPGAAEPAARVASLGALSRAGVHVSVRADPLVHGVMDTEESFAAVLAAAQARSVREVAASFLFLRPAIAAALRRHIADATLLDQVLTPYRQGVRFRLRGGQGSGLALPEAVRREAFARLRKIAEKRGMTLHVCGCKNPDLTDESCHISRTAGSERLDRELLWPEEKAPGQKTD
jgi:DNA repair photolyase